MVFVRNMSAEKDLVFYGIFKIMFSKGLYKIEKYKP